MDKLIALALTALVGAFIGSFLGSYLKKKGENLATHEDLDKLVGQVRAVTTTTKEIEAKISTGVWDRQKRWEMKREVLFEATKKLVRFEKALVRIESVFAAERKSLQPGELASLQAKSQAGEKWNDAVREFEEAGLLVAIVCGKEIKVAWDDYGLFGGQTVTEIFNNDPGILAKSLPALAAKFIAVTTAIRKELETDKIT